MIEPHILRRLIYVKMLLIHGSDHAGKNNFMDQALAVLHFDNAIEMLLYTIREKFDSDTKELGSFPQLIERVKNVLSKKIKLEEDSESFLGVRDILNMHIARNNIQHHGIIPSYDDIRRFQDFTFSFMNKVLPNIFQLNYEDVTLGNLIKNAQCNELISLAEKSYNSEKYVDTIIYSVYAFEIAKKVEQSNIYGSGIWFKYFQLRGSLQQKELVDFLDTVYDELEILKLRLDYRKYQTYRELLPKLTPTYSLTPTLDETRSMDETVYDEIKGMLNTTALEGLENRDLRNLANFYLNFVVESIIRWESSPERLRVQFDRLIELMRTLLKS
jgi:hypothetical protein